MNPLFLASICAAITTGPSIPSQCARAAEGTDSATAVNNTAVSNALIFMFLISVPPYQRSQCDGACVFIFRASGDPDKHATKEKLVEYVTSMACNGSIIVMHINRRGWHSAAALPDIIAILRKRAYKLVTVGELLADLKEAG